VEHNAFKKDSLTMSPEDLAKFYTSSGWLSEYALSCGYVERYDNGEEWLTLWKEGCYHVRHHDFISDKRICWESFDTLNEARKFFRTQSKELRQLV